MRNFLRIVVLAVVPATMVAGGCGKKEPAGGSGTASAPARDAAAAGAAGAAPDAAVAPPVRADVAAFAAIFDPVNARLDHVSRARTACEQRAPLLQAAAAIDKATPPAGHDAAAWLAAVESVQVAIDDMGEPCDQGNIKAIEAQVDAAKHGLDVLGH